jgi:hypothetical protein
MPPIGLAILRLRVLGTYFAVYLEETESPLNQSKFRQSGVNTMVSPINGDKPIAASTERSGESAKNSRREPASLAPSSSLKSNTAEPVGSIVEVDKARHLYDLENQTARVTAAEITTPEAARSLLDQILEQLNRAPEQAMKSQASGASAPLANLLQAAPA